MNYDSCEKLIFYDITLRILYEHNKIEYQFLDEIVADEADCLQNFDIYDVMFNVTPFLRSCAEKILRKCKIFCNIGSNKSEYIK